MKIVCETGTLADAVNRAARVSPTKGAAYEKAAGVVIVFDGTSVYVMATDLEVTYRQVFAPAHASPDPFTWRLPAEVLSGFIGGLPMHDGSTVTMEFDSLQGQVVVSSKKTEARFNTIDLGGFPIPHLYPTTMLKPVEGFARRVQQVAFATDRKADGVLSGVHVTGSKLYGFDRSRLAVVDCTVPVAKAVTVPLAPLAGVMRNTADLRVGVIDDRLVIQPDDDTQASTIIFADKYPDVEGLLKRLSAMTGRCTFSIDSMTSALGRMMVLVRDQRYPRVDVTYDPGSQSIRLDMFVKGLGQMKDEFECTLENISKTVTYTYTPTYLLEGLAQCAGPNIVMELGEDPLKPCTLDDADGFRYMFMPRDPRKDAS